MFLYYVIDKLGDIYYRLGNMLKVDTSFIKKLRHDHRKVNRITYEVLARWRSNAKTRDEPIDHMGMLHELCDALRLLNENLVADEITTGECLNKINRANNCIFVCECLCECVYVCMDVCMCVCMYVCV